MLAHARAAALCTDCDSLLRKPYTPAAHGRLKDVARKSRPKGTVEMFSCTRCGTNWEQFRRSTGGAHAAVWRTI